MEMTRDGECEGERERGRGIERERGREREGGRERESERENLTYTENGVCLLTYVQYHLTTIITNLSENVWSTSISCQTQSSENRKQSF